MMADEFKPGVERFHPVVYLREDPDGYCVKYADHLERIVTLTQERDTWQAAQTRTFGLLAAANEELGRLRGALWALCNSLSPCQGSNQIHVDYDELMELITEARAALAPAPPAKETEPDGR